MWIRSVLQTDLTFVHHSWSRLETTHLLLLALGSGTVYLKTSHLLHRCQCFDVNWRLTCFGTRTQTLLLRHGGSLKFFTIGHYKKKLLCNVPNRWRSSPLTQVVCSVLLNSFAVLNSCDLVLQACRGGEYDAGVDVTDADVFSDSKTVLYRLPKEADFLYAYSTTPGRNVNAWMSSQYVLYSVCYYYCEISPYPPLDNIQVMVIVWRLRGNIIRTAPCSVVWHNVHSQQHIHVSSSYRSSRLGLSHWDPYAVHRGGCLELYYCNMVEWCWWDSSLIWKTN